MLDATWAGQRVVSVGANGIVLLSDNRGATYRQAKSVPVSSTLTSVSFIDARTGWAVGHWGAILKTTDGGETWEVQRLATGEDRPLFGVHFIDANHGVAVGLWSLILVTDDGGKTWTKREATLPNGKKSDLNLFGLFSNGNGEIFATAEKGQLLISRDKGNTWESVETGYKGSFWCGVALPNGVLLVGGLRGTLMRSEDNGHTWTRATLDTRNSITALASRGSTVLAVGIDGLQAQSTDDGKTFKRLHTETGTTYTAALPSSGDKWLIFSRDGVVSR
ncbi:glycosyl hydrolase [Burkholderia cenocepacia]|uniref:Glycosyl hydrolase n=1 Tax=Burkholderia stagnalis TaxID=1503054 RepID=A0A6L3MW43_9BURK|nr:glycosyl hydrolase [Burkholderia stagnalis]KAB1597316.1 glycosyl hydrolase [Burkholderia cepacia]MBR8275433.1 glycosyl hydrolase [Burkholderia cenocepacia]RQT57884.1 glycosyl hydrolase [Burkholderia cepacia]RQU31028.1 glycosyl hydrolase [Burkholderia cenocepacia]